MRVLIINGSTRPKDDTKQMILACRKKGWMSFASLDEV